MNLSEQVMEYLKYCEFRKKLDNNTLKAYRIDLRQFFEYIVNNGELVPSARSNCTTLPKQEYRLAGWLYRSATALCQRCEPLFR